MGYKIKQLRDALDLAVARLAAPEPGDSRAVSNEFVALAAVSCGLADDACMKIIRDALAEERAKALPPV